MRSKLKLKKRGKIFFFFLVLYGEHLDERKASQMTKNPILCMAENILTL